MVWVVMVVTGVMVLWVAAAYLIDDLWLGLLPALSLWATIMIIEIRRLWREKHDEHIKEITRAELSSGGIDGPDSV